MRPGARLQVGFDNDDDVQRLAKLLMKQLGLIQAGLDVAFESGCLPVLVGNTAIVEFVPLCAMWPVTAVRACVRHVQSRVATQFGN